MRVTLAEPPRRKPITIDLDGEEVELLLATLFLNFRDETSPLHEAMRQFCRTLYDAIVQAQP